MDTRPAQSWAVRPGRIWGGFSLSMITVFDVVGCHGEPLNPYGSSIRRSVQGDVSPYQ